MKKIPFKPKLVALAAVATLSASAWAANFTVGGIKYTSITEPSGSENGTCKVAYQNQNIQGDIVIPDFVTCGGAVILFSSALFRLLLWGSAV